MQIRDSGPLARTLLFTSLYPHLTVSGASVFAPQAALATRSRPGVSFFPLFVALGAQKWGRRGPKGAPCGPKAPKSPPGDAQKSMKNQPRGLMGCPDVPGGLGGTRRTEKKHKKSQQTTPLCRRACRKIRGSGALTDAVHQSTWASRQHYLTQFHESPQRGG